MSEKRKYDSTVARIAGNILSGQDLLFGQHTREELARRAVMLARAIVAETERTQPQMGEAGDDPSC